MVPVVQPVPADPIGRKGAVVIDEDEAKTVTDHEAVIGTEAPSNVTLESLFVSGSYIIHHSKQKHRH